MDLLYQPCLRQEAPYDDESLLGLCYRLSIANHYESPSWLLPEGVSFYNKGFLALDKFIFHLSILSGLEESVLHAMSVGSLKIKDVKNHVNKGRQRFCPLCMREKPYHRLNWLLDWNFVCEEHGVYLADKCLNCGANITLSALLNGDCSCGFRFINTPGFPASSSDLEIQKLLNAKQNNRPADAEVLEKTNPALLLPSDLFMSLVLLLSKILRRHPTPSFALPSDLLAIHRRNHINISSVKMTAGLLSLVFNLLARWPLNFWQYLTELRASSCAAERSKKSDVEYDFSYLFRWLKREITDRRYTFVWDAIIDFLNKDPGKYIFIEELVQYSNKKKSYVTRQEVLRTLHVRHAKLEKLEIACGVKSSKRKLAKRTRSVYSIDDYHKLMQTHKDSQSNLTLRGASERLGIDRKITAKLIDGGLLKTAKRIRRNYVAICQDSVRKLESLIERPCPSTPGEDASEWMNLQQVMKYLKYQVTYSDFLVLALNDHISYKVSENGKGLNRLLFCPKEIDATIRRKSEIEIEKQGMPIYKVEAILHITINGIKQLIKLGLLAANSVIFKGKQSYGITKDQIAEFRNKYTFIPEASEKFRVPKNTIRGWVKNGLIPSATRFGKHGGEQYVFEKKDLVRILEFRNIVGTRSLQVSPDLGTIKLRKGQVATFRSLVGNIRDGQGGKLYA
jgi:hypothetical protein